LIRGHLILVEPAMSLWAQRVRKPWAFWNRPGEDDGEIEPLPLTGDEVAHKAHLPKEPIYLGLMREH
jgi:hypothetical protein